MTEHTRCHEHQHFYVVVEFHKDGCTTAYEGSSSTQAFYEYAKLTHGTIQIRTGKSSREGSTLCSSMVK